MPEGGWDRRRRLAALAIERVAIELFARDGYQAVTVEQIARAAHMHERTFFRYFATKDDVLMALPRRAIYVLVEAFRELPTDKPFFDAMGDAVMATDDLLREDEQLRFAWASALRKAPEVAYRVGAEVSDLMFASVSEVVARRLDDDAESLRVGVVTSALTSVLSYTWQRWIDKGGEGKLSLLIIEGFHLLDAAELQPRHDDDEVARLRAQVAVLSAQLDTVRRVASLPLFPGDDGPFE